MPHILWKLSSLTDHSRAGARNYRLFIYFRGTHVYNSTDRIVVSSDRMWTLMLVYLQVFSAESASPTVDGCRRLTVDLILIVEISSLYMISSTIQLLAMNAVSPLSLSRLNISLRSIHELPNASIHDRDRFLDRGHTALPCLLHQFVLVKTISCFTMTGRICSTLALRSYKLLIFQMHLIELIFLCLVHLLCKLIHVIHMRNICWGN